MLFDIRFQSSYPFLFVLFFNDRKKNNAIQCTVPTRPISKPRFLMIAEILKNNAIHYTVPTKPIYNPIFFNTRRRKKNPTNRYTVRTRPISQPPVKYLQRTENMKTVCLRVKKTLDHSPTISFVSPFAR